MSRGSLFTTINRSADLIPTRFFTFCLTMSFNKKTLCAYDCFMTCLYKFTILTLHLIL